MPDSFANPLTALLSDLTNAEDMLQALLNVSLTAVNILRPVFGPAGEVVDFIMEYVNPAGQRMLGLPEQPGISLLQSYPDTDQTGVFNFYKQVFETNIPSQFDISYINEGQEIFFHVAAHRSGQLLVAAYTDVFNQNREALDKALRDSHIRSQATRADADFILQQLYSIFMDTPAMICILTGPNHVFKLVNPPYQALVGNRSIIGKPIAEAMPELAGQGIFELLDNVYQTGKTISAHERLVQLDHDNTGKPLEENFYNFIYQPTHNPDGEIDGILVFAYEVTEQVLARRQVQTLNEQLEAKIVERTKAMQQARTEADHQRKRLERLFMEAPTAISILSGPDLVYELVNPAYEALFPDRGILGKPILAVIPEIEHHPVYKTFREVYETGNTHVEKELLVPLARPGDGKLEDRYFKYIQQARFNEQGQIDGVLVFVFEVTDQVVARQSIEASARQMRLITDALPVLIGYLDQAEKYRFANQAYEAWFNLKPEALLGKPIRVIIGEKAYANVQAYIKRALAGERLDFEANMPYRPDFVKHIRTSYVPDVRNGVVIGFYTMVHDITDQVLARQAVEESEQQAKQLADELAQVNHELRNANEQLMRTNVDLDNFIYTASHDLKAPILNIEGLMAALVDLLPAEHLQPRTVQRTIELIQESVQRFKETISHLTEITKLQKENNPTASPVNLLAVINDVQLDLAPQIATAKARIEVDARLCPTIRFSRKNLRSIIYNLLSNAIKYSSPLREPVVHLYCRNVPGFLVLSVRDNGLGIDLAKEQKLFAMFKRLHNHVEGTGIGLYMVKKIIQNAGGKIEVESKVGEGSVFYVYFPIVANQLQCT